MTKEATGHRVSVPFVRILIRGHKWEKTEKCTFPSETVAQGNTHDRRGTEMRTFKTGKTNGVPLHKIFFEGNDGPVDGYS